MGLCAEKKELQDDTRKLDRAEIGMLFDATTAYDRVCESGGEPRRSSKVRRRSRRDSKHYRQREMALQSGRIYRQFFEVFRSR